MYRKFSNEEKELIKFTKSALFMEWTKLFILVVIFSLQGRIIDFLYLFIVMSLLRAVSGGFHLKTYMSCLAFSYAYYQIVILLSLYSSNHLRPMAFICSIGLMLLTPVYPRKLRTSNLHEVLVRKLLVLLITIPTLLLLADNNLGTGITLVIISQFFMLLITKGKRIYEKTNTKTRKLLY